MSKELDYLGEGPADDALARRLIEALGGLPGKPRRTPLSGGGKSNLDRRLKGLNAGLYHGGSPLLVLRDLDTDGACASNLVSKLLPNRHDSMLLRICVKESESWILADAAAYASYCGVPVSKIPQDADCLSDPKQTIISWIKQNRASKLARHIDNSRKRGVPDWAALVSWNLTFVEQLWDPIRAAESGRSRSLRRTISRLREFVSA